MFSCLSRTATALALVFSLLVSISAVVGAQTQDQKQAKAPTDISQQSKGRPLATNEDPRLIGKRNINKGLIAKLSGSLEKEVALGRQLAAEVNQEAKFVNDPSVTEYVNRVGQNLALHSDAKV